MKLARPAAVLLLVSCAAAGASRSDAPHTPRDAAAERTHTEADTRFVQGMIAHHVQAVVMTDMVPSRTARDEIRLLALRMDVSQQDEVRMMRTWLARRGEQVPDSTAAHAHHDLMPGMLTAVELERLAAAVGDAFDRLFLELMIRHHEGALTMVAGLFTDGGGQEPELFQLASHIDADQRAEIARMRRLLTSIVERGVQ